MEKTPKNKKHFSKLRDFAKEVLSICKEASIEPVLYGSYLILEYTGKTDIEINDFDFFVKDEDLEKLAEKLGEIGINYEFPKEWHTLIVFKDDLRLEFDSLDYWYKGKKEFQEINFFGFEINAISQNSLKKQYKEASENSDDNSEGNRKKYEMLAKI